MPPKSDEPLYRVHLNLFQKDVEELKRLYGGFGWTEQVRLWVRDKLKERKRMLEQMND